MANAEADGRGLPKRMLIIVVLVAVLFAFGIAGFVVLEGVSAEQAFYMTLDSLAFIFHAESGPVKILEVSLTIFGLVIIWWSIWNVLDMVMAGNFSEYIKARKFVNKVRRMENHYIIAGGGRVGEEIMKGLFKKGEKCVIIERDGNTVSKLKKKNFVVMQGDAHDESLLKQAGIMSARAMIITLPDPEKALVATMIAKELNEKLDVFVRCENPSFVNRLKKAGAKSVVVPEAVAADKLMDEIGKL